MTIWINCWGKLTTNQIFLDYIQVISFDCLPLNQFRNKIRKSNRRTDSLATINLEDFFGPISIDSRDSVKHPYPNTVPQPKNSLAKAFGLDDDDSFEDDMKPTFSSASLLKNRRPSHEHNPKAT